MGIVWLTSLFRRPEYAAVAVAVALVAPGSVARAHDGPGPEGVPGAEVAVTDGAAVEAALAEVGLDAAWRSATGLGPIARALEVEYRGDEGHGVELLLTTATQLGTVTDEHASVVRELRGVAIALNEARERERDREIERNRADAYFRGMHALMQSVAVNLFAGGNPAGEILLGLDGDELTFAHRVHELTSLTLDEMMEQRRQAEADFLAAVDAHERAIRTRTGLEQERATLSASASELARAAAELQTTARTLLPLAAVAITLADVPREPKLTPRALDAYVNAELTMTEVQPGCRISWRTVAAVAAVEGSHGTHGNARLGMDGVPDRDIIGLALDGVAVDNLGETVALVADTDNGRWDQDRVYDRAVGPLQFIPGSWSRWARDGDGDGATEPQDIDDAALAAAAYLCNYGSLRSWDTWNAAVFGYNHSPAYVNSVKASLDRVDRVRLPDVEEAGGLQPRRPAGTWVALPVPDPEAEGTEGEVTAAG